MVRDIAVYGLAALCEIGGCFAVWQRVRHDAPAWILAPGLALLALFAFLLTRVDSAAAGRAYAAYGGIYIAASVLWLFLAEGVRPTATDIAGGAVCVLGAVIILAGARLHG